MNCFFGPVESLSNAGGLWSVILPLLVCTYVNSVINEILLRKGLRGQRILFGNGIKTQVGRHRFAAINHGVRSTKRKEGQKNSINIPRLPPARCYVRITSGNLSCDINVVVFVGAG